MRAISSKLNFYIKSLSVINNNIQKLTLNAIFCSLGILTLLYLIFLGNTIKNIIERRSFEANARTLSSEVRDLELQYLSLSNNIDLALSHSMGFKEIKTTFVTRKAVGVTKITPNDL